jgi:hypothetical protein
MGKESTGYGGAGDADRGACDVPTEDVVHVLGGVCGCVPEEMIGKGPNWAGRGRSSS